MTKRHTTFAIIVMIGFLLIRLESKFGESVNNGVSVMAQESTDPCAVSVDDFATSSSGTLLAIYDGTNNSILLYNISLSLMLDKIELTQDRVTDIAFSADEKILIWSASNIGIDDHLFNGNIYYYDTETRSVVSVFENMADVVTDLYMPENSDFIVFRGQYPGYEKDDIQTLDIETGDVKLIREAWHIVPAYSDNMIAMGITASLGISNEFAYQIELYSLGTTGVSQTMELSEQVQALALNSSKALIVSVDNDGNLILWDLEGEHQVDAARIENVLVKELAITNDGDVVINVTTFSHDMLLIRTIDDLQEPVSQLNFESGILLGFSMSQNNSTIFVVYEEDRKISFGTWQYHIDNFEEIHVLCS